MQAHRERSSVAASAPEKRGVVEPLQAEIRPVCPGDAKRSSEEHKGNLFSLLFSCGRRGFAFHSKVTVSGSSVETIKEVDPALKGLLWE